MILGYLHVHVALYLLSIEAFYIIASLPAPSAGSTPSLLARVRDLWLRS